MSEKFLSSLKNELAGHAVWDVLKILLEICLAAVGGLLSSKLLTLGVPRLAQLTPYLEVFCALVGLLIFFLFYQRFNRRRPRFPRLPADFLVLEKTITYQYFSKTTMRYSRKLRLKALRNRLGTYSDKYLWTGSGQVKIRCANPAQQVTPTHRKSVWQIYEVRFEKILNKRDIIDIEIIWDLENQAERAVPFFSTTVDEPTKLLRLNLSLEPSLGVSSVTWEISSGIGAMAPFDSDTLTLDKHGEVSWVIEHPKLLHYYELRWYMPQGAKHVDTPTGTT